MDDTDEFLKVWAAVGPIVGVVTGLIPAYFFHNMAKDSSDRADKNSEKMGTYKGMLMGHGYDPVTGLPMSNKSQDTGKAPKPS
jgi:hypothetical protein